MASIPKNSDWKNFFECLRNLPSLWKIKDDVFRDKNIKRKSWETLLASYREIEPDAKMDDVKKRLLSVKSCYRRELKKVVNSERSGCGSNEVHVPNLWYFDCLDFLKDQFINGLSTIELDEEFDPFYTTQGSSSSSKKKKKHRGNENHFQHEKNDLLRVAVENVKNSHSTKVEESVDEAEIYGRSWSASFRKLPLMQKLYAKKAIEDILILGQLNQLTLNTVSMQISSESSRAQTPLFGISPSSSEGGYFSFQSQNIAESGQDIVGIPPNYPVSDHFKPKFYHNHSR